MSYTNHAKKKGMNTGARDWQAVADSYKAYSVLLIVKSSKSHVGDRGKKKLYVKY